MRLLTEAALEHYGVALRKYAGHGIVTLTTQRQAACEFVAAQLENGKTILLCATEEPLWGHLVGVVDAQFFSGTTHEGLRVEAVRNVSETTYLSKPTESGTYFALRIGHLKVSRAREEACSRLTFTLTNLAGIRRDLPFTIHGKNLLIRPHRDAVANLQRLNVTRGVLPTAEVELEAGITIEDDIEVVDEACYLLSIALGTKVQWIALTEWTSSGDWSARNHYSRVTKRYGSLAAINPSEGAIEEFMKSPEAADFGDARKAVGLTNAVIDTYLDAKAEGDFLEVRGLKLVVAVEMLKAAFQDATRTSSLAIALEDFEKLRPALKEAVKDAIVGETTPEQRCVVYENLAGLNRVPFSAQLRRLCSAVKLPLDDTDLRRFVASRNRLVHEGHFYCEKASERDRDALTPLGSQVEEWFWLLHFVDRLFLKAAGYSGAYVDWSVPGKPKIGNLWPTA